MTARRGWEFWWRFTGAIDDWGVVNGVALTEIETECGKSEFTGLRIPFDRSSFYFRFDLRLEDLECGRWCWEATLQMD